MEKINSNGIGYRAKVVLLIIVKAALMVIGGFVIVLTTLLMPITYIFFGIDYPIGFKLIEYVDDKIKIKY